MKSRFARFTLVGLFGIALQLSLLSLLTNHFLLRPVTATALAVEITLLHNFLWHECFTWPDRTMQNLRLRALRLYRFHLCNGLVSLLGNTFVTYCLVDHLSAPPIPSALASIGLCGLANFALADRWVYHFFPPPGNSR
jgi:putative flippase GtrA